MTSHVSKLWTRCGDAPRQDSNAQAAVSSPRRNHKSSADANSVAPRDQSTPSAQQPLNLQEIVAEESVDGIQLSFRWKRRLSEGIDLRRRCIADYGELTATCLLPLRTCHVSAGHSFATGLSSFPQVGIRA